MRTKIELKHQDCQLNTEPFFMCCCTCVFHWPVHHHCCTEPKPKMDERESGGCHCTAQKKTNDGKELNWACVAPEFGRVYDNWGAHGCGCELHTTEEDMGDREKQKESDRKELGVFRKQRDDAKKEELIKVKDNFDIAAWDRDEMGN